MLCCRKKAAAAQKQDILDPLWTSNSQHEYRMAAMWATLRQLRLACTGLLAHLDQLNARCVVSWSVGGSLVQIAAGVASARHHTPRVDMACLGVNHMSRADWLPAVQAPSPCSCGDQRHSPPSHTDTTTSGTSCCLGKSCIPCGHHLPA